ncbi:hypothetical protein CASFOL_032722 [Castilleja foliolosa]|uniref:Stigma-specific Stig1 family protein n=1 Tax=Castilleja foliolosa TaxID=1961234 RepID=A0ABD3C425_9LAMI
MKVFMKFILFTAIALAMAVTRIVNSSSYKRPVSRFLQQSATNPRSADHCNKDNEACNYVLSGRRSNATCCNNKCMDLWHDDKNCGACKKKCDFTDACCNGECVNLAFDKRHCGSCNHRCMPGGYCIYGMCDYA